MATFVKITILSDENCETFVNVDTISRVYAHKGYNGNATYYIQYGNASWQITKQSYEKILQTIKIV